MVLSLGTLNRPSLVRGPQGKPGQPRQAGLDGVFSENENGEAKFFEATELGLEVVEKTGQQIRERVLRYLKKQGDLTPHEAEDMLTWEHGGGVSLDAEVKISAGDRDGLEKLAWYCARPSFADQLEPDREEPGALCLPQGDGRRAAIHGAGSADLPSPRGVRLRASRELRGSRALWSSLRRTPRGDGVPGGWSTRRKVEVYPISLRRQDPVGLTHLAEIKYESPLV